MRNDQRSPVWQFGFGVWERDVGQVLAQGNLYETAQFQNWGLTKRNSATAERQARLKPTLIACNPLTSKELHLKNLSKHPLWLSKGCNIAKRTDASHTPSCDNRNFLETGYNILTDRVGDVLHLQLVL